MKRSTVILAAALGATALNVLLYSAWHDAVGYAVGLYRRHELDQHDLGELRRQAALRLPDHPPAEVFARHEFLPVVEDPALVEVPGA